MEFRDYRKNDFEAMFELDELCFDEPFRFSRAAMRRFAEAKNALVVMAEEDGLAGFCIVHVERVGKGCVGYVVTLDVAERFRRRGLARALMQILENAVVDEGCDAMALHVSTENAGAIRFYERGGYARVGKAREFYGDAGDAWIYRKALTEVKQGVEGRQ